MTTVSLPEIEVTDIRAAVALLSLEYDLIEPSTALDLITSAKSEEQLVSFLLEKVKDTEVLKAIGKERGIVFFDPYEANPQFTFNDKVFRAAKTSQLTAFAALPLVDNKGNVVVAVNNPDDVNLLDYLSKCYPEGFQLVLSHRSAITNRINFYTSTDLEVVGETPQQQPSSTPVAPRASAGSSNPMQEWIDHVLNRAVAAKSSDIHFLMQENGSLVLRFRVDGVLRKQTVPSHINPREAVGAIISRCATMDSANMREPQDGKFSFTSENRNIDARVAMLPQSHGPTVVIRLLDSSNIQVSLDNMGFTHDQVNAMKAAMNASQGTVLAVGPTGSGKSTTLYALLQEVDANEKNVLTVENPVEYRLPMIGQTEIRDGLGERSLTFARALRSILRLDPDVILVGEIRDHETAETAMHASITGHLVLSTLHANTALGSYSRLVSMGLPAYLVAESLTLTLYQRLLRRVHNCAKIRPPHDSEILRLRSIGLEAPPEVAEATGCAGCAGAGYQGRIAAVEVLTASSGIRDLVNANATASSLAKKAREEGFIPIHVNAQRHLADQLTTVSELFRSLPTDELKEQWM